MTIAIVDDHPIVRDGIERLIVENDSSRVVRTFDRAEDLFSALDRGEPTDLCLLDIGLPGIGGIEALGEMRTRWPDLPVIVLTAQPARAVAVRCLRSGARGFLSKGQDPHELFDAIEVVLAGGRAVGPNDVKFLIEAVSADSELLPHERLSDREFVIMRRLAAGESILGIAEDLCISPKTVSTYRRRCLAKMGLERNSQLTEYVLTHLDPPQTVS